MDKIAVIDVETTGLSPWRNDRVIEIAIVVISADGAIQTEYETLVNPCRDIGPSSIHHISAADVFRAPTFADIAGDVLAVLANASIVAGHNVSFDRAFLVKEFATLGVTLPEIPLLCTCQLFGRNNLQACCDELGITRDGIPHQAISDARTTARIVSFLCSDDIALLDTYRIKNVNWPSIPLLRTACFRRQNAEEVRKEPPRFLQRISTQIHHDVEAGTPNVLAYMTLVDRVLEDRVVDENEETALVDAALKWNLAPSQLTTVHTQYIHNLAMTALADGIVSDSERRDLHTVARLLGQDDASLDALLAAAAAQLASSAQIEVTPRNKDALRGKKVCFTGQLQSTIRGQPITRELAERLAMQAGLDVASNVTKRLDVLVVADPNTQSTKARKARDYGIRILADAVFWSLTGVKVD